MASARGSLAGASAVVTLMAGCALIAHFDDPSSGAGGAGGAGGLASSSMSAMVSASSSTSGEPCNKPQDCAGIEGECRHRVCLTSGFCRPDDAPADTALSEQTKGDCSLAVCDGHGGIKALPDAQDVPLDDNNECTTELCVSGKPTHDPVPDKTKCGTSALTSCKAGACVGCVFPGDCGTPGECFGWACMIGKCKQTPKAEGQACGAAAACSMDTLQPQGICQMGSCVVPATHDCGGYACEDATSCKTVCAGDGDCDPNHYCKATVCILKLSVGAACTGGSECLSTFCSEDKYCCTQACAGSICVGNSAGATSCAKGDCMVPNPVDCGVYACKSGACPTMCAGSGDCTAGAKCSGIQCCAPCSAWLAGNVPALALCSMSSMLFSGVSSCCKSSSLCYQGGGPCAPICNSPAAHMTPACEACLASPSECQSALNLCKADL